MSRCVRPARFSSDLTSSSMGTKLATVMLECLLAYFEQADKSERLATGYVGG